MQMSTYRDWLVTYINELYAELLNQDGSLSVNGIKKSGRLWRDKDNLHPCEFLKTRPSWKYIPAEFKRTYCSAVRAWQIHQVYKGRTRGFMRDAKPLTPGIKAEGNGHPPKEG